jgi:hypothetical protein
VKTERWATHAATPAGWATEIQVVEDFATAAHPLLGVPTRHPFPVVAQFLEPLGSLAIGATGFLSQRGPCVLATGWRQQQRCPCPNHRADRPRARRHHAENMSPRCEVGEFISMMH